MVAVDRPAYQFLPKTDVSQACPLDKRTPGQSGKPMADQETPETV
jgi:hypothetical protein